MKMADEKVTLPLFQGSLLVWLGRLFVLAIMLIDPCFLLTHLRILYFLGVSESEIEREKVRH